MSRVFAAKGLKSVRPPILLRSPLRKISGGFWEGVVEAVGMFAVGYGDRHFTGEAGQLAGAGIWHDSDGQLRDAAGHRAAVLEDEAAAMTSERSGNALDGDVASRAFDACAGGEHLALAGSFEIAVELFVDRHSAESSVLEFSIRRLGIQFHFKRPACVRGHGCSLLGWLWDRRA